MSIVEQQIKVNGLMLNYSEKGTGGTPIIFLHNGGGFWQSWYHQINHFGDKQKVYALDWPGFGESDPAEGLLSLELLTNTLSTFIELMGIEKVVLIGNCIGGSAALNYSLDNPERVSKLVILNICPGDLIIPKFYFRKLITGANFKEKRKKRLTPMLAFSFLKTPVKKKFPKILFGKSYDPNSHLAQKYVEKFKQDSQTDSRINLLFSAFTYNLKELLNDRAAPEHLLIWGAENTVTSLDKHGRYHKEILKPDEFHVIEDAGHLCIYEQPELVSELIEKYIHRS